MQLDLILLGKTVFRFDGTTFKAEQSSKFSHKYVYSLGSYRRSPFVAGSADYSSGLKTEIFKWTKDSRQWIQAKDYPFSDVGR